MKGWRPRHSHGWNGKVERLECLAELFREKRYVHTYIQHGLRTNVFQYKGDEQLILWAARRLAFVAVVPALFPTNAYFAPRVPFVLVVQGDAEQGQRLLHTGDCAAPKGPA